MPYNQCLDKIIFGVVGIMYDKVSGDLDFAAREKEILEFWKQNKIFDKTVEKTKGKQTFCFYEGPPTANGKPHIGHILTRVMKDIIPRYKIMKGYSVLRKAGWDTHGLPVELEVEKQLGLDGKQDIEKFGIEPFIKKCKESVWKYKSEWERMTERVGFWVDMENPYVTYDDDYIESVWWSIKQFFDKGLLYKGHKVVPYCPRCGTALSSHEVAQGYKDVKDKSVFVKFRLKDAPDTYFLAWTTTPWTLPSNVALCMNPDEDYALIERGGEKYILAAALVKTLFEIGASAGTSGGTATASKSAPAATAAPVAVKILSIKKGREYERVKYLPLFDYKLNPQDAAKAYYMTCDGYVTLDSGTGIVHIAPAFGEDDSNVGKRYGLPFVRLVNERGLFTDEAYDIKGTFVKDADRVIIKRLKDGGNLFKELLYEHSYPFCWRCDTPLLYYARPTWFLKMSAVKERLVKNNASINWLPPAIGSGRMGNFLENVVDWGLSRERYWGTPLPVWVCDKCQKIEVIGSKAELKQKCGGTAECADCAAHAADNNVAAKRTAKTAAVPAAYAAARGTADTGSHTHATSDTELHRPYIDKLKYACACGGTLRRTPEVVDCWYDSGSMPFAQHHYPFENKRLFDKNFPADFISEAVDQTRGWFYTLLAISTVLFDKSPFKNCIVLGHVNDKDGIKMSKHKGNVVDPWAVLNKQGADAVRWYFYTSSAPWLPSRFYDEAVSEAQRKYLGTLWNTYAFFVLYADIDKFDPTKYKLKDLRLSLMDKWILSELNGLIDFVDLGLENYMITETSRRLQEFADNLSNWYVRRNRERFWGADMTDDKAAAYATLYHCLVTAAKLTAPFTPFVAESIYQNLVRGFDKSAPLSVHLNDFPTADKKYIDAALSEGMQSVLNIVVLGRACRNECNLKNRQPLSELYILSEGGLKLDGGLLEVVREELNVKSIKIIKDLSAFSGYELKPQLKTLGPRYGAGLGKIREYLTCCDAEKIVAAVNAGGVFAVDLDGLKIELKYDDLLITAKSKAGFASKSEGSLTVVLDTALSEELLDEGCEREIVSKIQTMRKESGLNVTDRIKLKYEASGRNLRVLGGKKDKIAPAVLADSITAGKGGTYKKEWDINGEGVVFYITLA
jgi:isoleucyl-tRNA synthetase